MHDFFPGGGEVDKKREKKLIVRANRQINTNEIRGVGVEMSAERISYRVRHQLRDLTIVNLD